MKAQIRVTGAVQGVGYRPFVAELANKYHLDGEVRNSGGIVEIVALGDIDAIKAFADNLRTTFPAGSIVRDVKVQIINDIEPESLPGFSGFRIVKSSKEDEQNSLAVFPPDIGLCDKCLKEMTDPKDRRYRYPLISCTSCGPRYSILKSLPYDRENITMDAFPMCRDCSKEYMTGRRRHAQTISCHKCGPQYKLSDGTGGDAAITRIIEILNNGGIVGLKGTGGYQLICSPYNEETVERLRLLKGRETKPFAIMFPNIENIKYYCNLNETEREYLESSARPIVLLDKISNIYGIKDFSGNVCGRSLQIGAFLPGSGIHAILTQSLGPLIVTSGNRSGDPMIVNDAAFCEKFGDQVEAIIYNDREILRPMDDSVLQVVSLPDGVKAPRFIRRSRGYVPLPLFLEEEMENDIFYVSFGADLKNTFCLGYRDRLIQSQYLGDMEDLSVRSLQKSEIKEALNIFGMRNLGWKKIHVICDLHPGYASTEDAKEYYNRFTLESKNKEDDKNKELIKIQHHHAHIGSVMAEHNLKKCIGIAFDGTGYGIDGTIWGSEFLICDGSGFERIMHFRNVSMTGGDEAMKNAGVSATAYLYDAGIDHSVLDKSENNLVRSALSMGINTWKNCGMGRLFDSVSCMLGICDYNSYEGECASMLQNAAEKYAEECVENDKPACTELLNLPLKDGEFDTRYLIRDIYDRTGKRSSEEIAYLFHLTIADAVVRAAILIREKYSMNEVSLSGGVFANRLLFSMCVKNLKNENFVVYYNRIFPANDGGISAGQIYLDSLRED